jgi:hypothetical protein
VLSHYPDVPEAATTSAALDSLAAAPATPLFQFDYGQTPASVADIADQARSMRRQVLAAKVWLPLALAAGVALSLVVGFGVALRRGRTGPSRSTAGSPPRLRPATARRGAGTTPGTSSA